MNLTLQVVQFHLFDLVVNPDRMLFNNGAADLPCKNSAAMGVITWPAWQHCNVGIRCADLARPKRSKEDFARWLFGALVGGNLQTRDGAIQVRE
ncbi:hypothetical protein [Stenotrophomonas sepilia]